MGDAEGVQDGCVLGMEEGWPVGCTEGMLVGCVLGMEEG